MHTIENLTGGGCSNLCQSEMVVKKRSPELTLNTQPKLKKTRVEYKKHAFIVI